MADLTFGPKVYKTNDGDKQVVASGGVLDIESGGTLQMGGSSVDALTLDPGAIAVGSIDFNTTGTGAMTITINGVAYLEANSAVPASGIWTNGSSAANSATSLIAAINGDTRATVEYTAIADETGDGVMLFADNVGSAGNFTLASDDGTATVSAAAMTGGADPELKTQAVYQYTVTSEDDLAGNFDVPLPFAPAMFQLEVRNSSGLFKAITALVTVETSPNRLRVNYDGGTNPAATDVARVFASS